MSDEIRVNGRLVDGSITIKVRGKEYYGFTEITYGSAENPRARELVRGQQ